MLFSWGTTKSFKYYNPDNLKQSVFEAINIYTCNVIFMGTTKSSKDYNQDSLNLD